MSKLPQLAGFEGLFDLDRRGVDVRPTLLRVLTDQFLQKPTHTPDEITHYTELALRLLDETDVATRAAVAVRLAPHACAPRPIVQQLSCDVLDVAEPMLRYSPCLTPADLQAIAEEHGPTYAEIIAMRGQPDAARNRPLSPHVGRGGDTPMQRPVLDIAGASALPAPAHAAATDPDFIVAQACGSQPADEADPAELCELFFAADSMERRLILLSLDYAADVPPQPQAILQRADVWRLESAALQHNTDAVIRDLERALGISKAQARRIVQDERGEPIVVAAKTMKLPADVLQRMLLFMNPRVGQSVERVYELAALHQEISIEAAQRLIAIFQDADPPAAAPARHEPQLQDGLDRMRQGPAESARRPALLRDANRLPLSTPAAVNARR